ncbi:hypothetical protein A2773_03940 [Candidatus Gottesmanbacteria bacterium RIFCSPHIGHO2_01_FULL_39_10]|uniref:DUF5615 domain-containing protein n=1 Tax=Candidatus Gottesmanbacteria bacterium RIFCSPHIGHO2_01_FULL_39_10 TaxID=1798375 RepID=A0A1F5ZQL7_9BACT|nr:MAG: hypothetical protein A2773_03940 [Candidatus Gottesmanbacteria bacterium RIFCSPHIGHO2_01_FULL_39_10]
MLYWSTTKRNCTISKFIHLSSKKHKKFRLLLDAAFAKSSIFKRLQKKANIKHIVFDLDLSSQSSDEEIYDVASKENRFVVTINYKDFQKKDNFMKKIKKY